VLHDSRLQWWRGVRKRESSGLAPKTSSSFRWNISSSRRVWNLRVLTS